MAETLLLHIKCLFLYWALLSMYCYIYLTLSTYYIEIYIFTYVFYPGNNYIVYAKWNNFNCKVPRPLKGHKCFECSGFSEYSPNQGRSSLTLFTGVFLLSSTYIRGHVETCCYSLSDPVLSCHYCTCDTLEMPSH